MVTRHRLNRSGDRQLNRAFHTVVVTRLRVDPATQAYAERRLAEGKSMREIRRCLKRYVAREIFRMLESMADRHDAVNPVPELSQDRERMALSGRRDLPVEPGEVAVGHRDDEFFTLELDCHGRRGRSSTEAQDAQVTVRPVIDPQRPSEVASSSEAPDTVDALGDDRVHVVSLRVADQLEDEVVLDGLGQHLATSTRPAPGNVNHNAILELDRT